MSVLDAEANRPRREEHRSVAFDERLAERVRHAVHALAPADEKRMFGGLAFMVNTHMACGLIGADLMVRVGPDGHDEAIARGAEEMTFTGRPMRSMVLVPADRLVTDEQLDDWVEHAVSYALAQPPKAPKKPKLSGAPAR